MKKTLIALAVAGVAVASAPVAMADAGAYGRITTALVVQDDDNDSLNVQSGSSRFGFKGTEDLGNGMSAVYRYEFAVNSDQTAIGSNNRLSYAGLKGGFGEITIGRHWAPFYENVVGRTDTFQAVGGNAPIIAGAVTSGDSANDHRGPSIRTGDTIKYSNNFGGITVGAMLQMRDNSTAASAARTTTITDSNGDTATVTLSPAVAATNDDDDIDRIDISVSGKAGALGWGAGFVSDAESQGDDTTFGVGVDFAVSDALSIVGAFVQIDNDATPDTEMSYSIGAIFQMGGGMQVQARFSENEEIATQFDLGFEKKFSKRTRIFAELENNEPENGDGTNVISLGVRHDF